MRRHYFPLIPLAAIAFSVSARAAAPLSSEDLMNMPLDKLMDVEVTSASKYPQKASEAPSAVEVITADDIRTYGYRTLGEALNGLHGLYVSSDRNYNYLGVRGFLKPGDYNSRVLIMIDGRRMNDNIYDEVDTGQLFMLDMDLVDHIEYIAGPGSSIYGANAMLGVINVITKKGADINGMQVKGAGGTFDTSTARATYGKKFGNGVDVLLSASEYYSGGPSDLFFPEFNSPATNNGIAHDMDAESARHYFGKIQYQDFTFTSGFVDRLQRVPTASFGTIFDDPGYHTDDASYYSELKYNKQLTDATQIELEGYDQWYRYHGDFPYDANGGAPPLARVVNYDGVYGAWWGGEAKLVTTALNRQKLVMGIDYQYDQTQHIFNYDISPAVSYQDTNRRGARTGVYAQDDIKLLHNLVLSTGLRFDETHMLKKAQINPRLGLIWNPIETTTVKLLYGSAFRAPNVYERDINTLGNAANPDNTEERIKTYESIVEWQPGTGLKLSGSLFYNDFTQVLVQDPVSEQFVNVGKYAAYGYDLGAEKRWAGGRSLKASLTHTILYDETDPTEMWAVNSPKNVGKLQYAEPLFDNKATLGAEDIFIDQRRTLQDSTANSYNLVNVNLNSRKIFPGAEASLGVYNLFSAHPQMVGGDNSGAVALTEKVIPMDGRNVQLSLQYTF